MEPIFVRLIIVLSAVTRCYSALNAAAWQSVGEDFTFPEMELAEVMSKPNVGVTFSGGGVRSYSASIGYMGAFHELGYFDHVRYIAGSSGGSWATAVYSYYQHYYVSDSVMLGPIVPPEEITYDELQEVNPDCVRSYPNITYDVDGLAFADWVDAVQEVYFNAAGIERGWPFSYDNDTVLDIKERNPSLIETPFLLLRGNFNESLSQGVDKRPYPIIQATMIGLSDLMPWQPSNRNYSMLEWTPLTAGVAYSLEVVYNSVDGSESIEKTIGGFVEPFAFAGDSGPADGLPAGASSGYLLVPSNGSQIYCDVALASGTSSWAPGCDIAASDSELIQVLAGQLNYWAPSAEDPAEQFASYATGDGGGVSNTDLISLLQRNVTSIIAFVNTNTPMKNSTHWDPATEGVGDADIDFTVPAWFGIIASNLSELSIVSYDLNNSQVFAPEEWLPLVTAMQEAQAGGNGIVVHMNHTTVENRKFGLQAGNQVEVLWIYLNRVLNWEADLSADMQELVVPDSDPDNQASLVQHPPFRHFPNYPTTLSSESIAEVNLLADFAGWTVYQNQPLFRAALGLPSLPIETDDPDSSNNNSKGSKDDDDDESFAESVEGLAVIVVVSLVVVAAVIAGLAYCYMTRSKNDGLLADEHRQTEMSSGPRSWVNQA